MLSKYGNCTRLLRIKNKKNSRYCVGVFNKTIIPLSVVGYEILIANSALRALLAIYHLISSVHL